MGRFMTQEGSVESPLDACSSKCSPWTSRVSTTSSSLEMQTLEASPQAYSSVLAF